MLPVYLAILVPAPAIGLLGPAFARQRRNRRCGSGGQRRLRLRQLSLTGRAPPAAGLLRSHRRWMVPPAARSAAGPPGTAPAARTASSSPPPPAPSRPPSPPPCPAR